MARKENAEAAAAPIPDDQPTTARDAEISEAAVDGALQEADGLVLPDISELESEGATQAFAVPLTPPFMQDDDADEMDGEDQQRG
ncbi:hypothetical protein [Rhizobium sp. TRM95796]|uniref:hypothetical protein n=1 Tax=Rhizobium sp. TRM95796 TaxID=2979862 RepID=UPI0021E81DFD|nr:hypothetical protein [Rhizobium sp. TRM95796]MCV3764979.1 hypothetical protein [Rhizobium sp. TRM95796]